MGRTVVLVLASVLVLQGCVSLGDARDAAWDPTRGDLFEQIPNELSGDSCGGQLRDHDRGSRSPRC